ncbi:MAG: NTF2-like N-terminal transpeptidase domain-containing protein [Gordonia sp. (in: high G+C Gram-positive bacteria)]|uniref:NTF2-like N-terminal transpeptidase domain-containing protein n=1 Tax=Gordonia sp. (in: high G+C Gram-positive bacteria) TaxID=84139 RepID=UPI0039E2A3C8
MRFYTSMAVVAAAASCVTVTSCSSTPTGAAAVVHDYASAISQQNIKRASELTTAPGQAADTLTETMDGMHAMAVDTKVKRAEDFNDGTAGFTLQTTYRWDDKRSFATETQGTARKLSSGWRVQWEPSLLYPGLRPGGVLRNVRADAKRAPRVLAANGKPFMVRSAVNDIVINPGLTKDLGATVRATARVIAPMAPQITSDVILQKIAAHPNEPVVAVTLRDPDMKVLDGNPARIPGVTVRKGEKLVMTNRQLSSPLEDGLGNYWQAIRDATAGWQVVVEQPGRAPERQAGDDGRSGGDISTTVSPRVQSAVGDAALDVAQPTTILALDAKTGGILGMGRNKAAADRGISIDGEYLTGSALAPVFDAITKQAKATGTPSDELLDHLGLGLVFTVPGASSPQRPGVSIQRIDYRPGEVRASLLNVGALGVALSRSMSGEKKSVAPFIIKGQTTKIHDGELGNLDGALTRPILAAMSRTVRTGDASDLKGAKGMRALVGTNGPNGPGWFLGLVGGKVIVVYTEGPRSGSAALQAVQKYLSVR